MQGYFRDRRAAGAELALQVVRHAETLELFAPGSLVCRVTVDHAEHRHLHGNRYIVRAPLMLPGSELEAGQTQAPDQAHEDPHRAQRDTKLSLKSLIFG
ncbi:MAG TPA: hypothetical protein VFE67_05715, partial [Rudaea sp.]|nr:hypothetical protein [Rudaea sp.]